MFSKSLSVAAAMAATASAFHLPTPENSYYGNLRTSLTCNAVDTNLVGLTLDSFSVALGPSIVEQGQQFYINDVAANLTIPAAIATALGLAVDHVNTLVHIFLDTEGLSPNPLNTVPAGVWINGTRFNALQDAHLIAPNGGGVVGGLGPLTAVGSPGSQARVFVESATAQLFLYGVAGNLIRSVTLYCARPPYAALLATYNIVPSTTPNPPLIDRGNRYLVPFPPLDEQSKFICYGVPYTGAFGSSSYTFTTSTCGTLDAYTEENDINNFANTTTQLTFNSTQIAALQQQYPGASTVDFTLNQYIFNVTNGAPDGDNGAPLPAQTFTYTLPSTGDLVIDIGENNIDRGLTFGPFTAVGSAANNDIMYFVPGAITATYNFRNSAGASVGSVVSTLVPSVDGFAGPGANIVPAGGSENPLVTGL